MARDKLIITSIVVVAIAVISVLVALSASGNEGMISMDNMGGMTEGGRMQTRPPKDVTIFFESETEVPTGKQAEVMLKVLDRQTNAAMQGAEVVIGIEKGLPMTTMDMTNEGMFSAENKGKGTYTFTFTPESDGYYTIHVHVIPPGKEMRSMMENHVDFVIVSQIGDSPSFIE